MRAYLQDCRRAYLQDYTLHMYLQNVLITRVDKLRTYNKSSRIVFTGIVYHYNCALRQLEAYNVLRCVHLLAYTHTSLYHSESAPVALLLSSLDVLDKSHVVIDDDGVLIARWRVIVGLAYMCTTTNHHQYNSFYVLKLHIICEKGKPERGDPPMSRDGAT